jgi:hypothetical protein
MRCETFRDRYDQLDSGEEPGFFLRAHLASCPECRLAAGRLEAGLQAWRAADEAEALRQGEILDQRIMAAVLLLPRPRKELHARNWALSGMVIFLSLALIPFSKDFSLLRQLFGEGYSLPLFLVLGLVLTLFGGVFIATHMEELEPYVKRHLGGAPRT